MGSPSAEREAIDALIDAARGGLLDAAQLADGVATVVRRVASGEHGLEALLTGLVPGRGGRRLEQPTVEGVPVPGHDVPPTMTEVESAAVVEALVAARGKASTMPPPRPKGGGRYVVVTEIGRGGAGVVVGARDADIGRTVAMKTLRAGTAAERTEVQRFVDEARIAGQLEHPAIVPIYDLGALPDGQPFYTMRVVERRTLRGVLGALAHEEGPDGEAHREWPLSRLCHVIIQISRALDYAHQRGVVHRDLKPENILLGRFGEVYLADWGLAKLAGPADAPTPRRPDLEALSFEGTRAGSLMGTIGYMSPEQILGGVIDGRSDLFALGVVLYEVLTHGRARPFEGSTPFATLIAATESTPRRPRDLSPACPIVLDELCMRLLAKEPSERPPTGQAVADEVESYLEGDKERARRTEEALRLVAEARGHVARHEELYAERDRYLAEARALLRDKKPHDAAEAKHAGWRVEDQARDVEIQQADALAHAQHAYARAIGLAPDLAEVRRGLADLHWLRAERAVATHDRAAQTYNEALVREYDALEGRYLARLSADARLSLTSDPPGAEVVAHRFVERDRVLVLADPEPLGTTPLAEVRLPPGSFLLVIRRAGRRDTRLPLLARRGAHHVLSVNLYTDAEIGEDFVYVPGGPCEIGGDPDAFDPLPRREVYVGDFALARHPITFGEYLAFVDDLWARDPKEADKRVPRDESGDGRYAMQDATGRWVPRYDRLIEGEGRRFSPEARATELPVMAIDWFDAMAYLRWRATRDGASGTVRLPTEVEYEKAMRGADGRRFPWGDGFDPTFCKMRESRPGFPQPEPVGAFAVDQSPYGVADLAGGMREWVADVSADGVEAELSVEAALAAKEPPFGAPRTEAGMRITRGGAWCDAAIATRAASRVRYLTLFRTTRIGFRRVRPLGR